MKWTFVAVLKKSIAVQWCAWHRGVKILGLTNQIFFLQIFSFIIDLFTPERISPDCPFKRNQRFSKISILMHTAELDPTVWCTPGSLTPRYDAPIGAFLRNFGSLDTSVWCTPRSLTPWRDAHRGVRLPVWQKVFVFFWIPDVYVWSKNIWIKKYSLNNLWLSV